MSKKRPAASIASLEREIAKLKKENAELRGEDPKKKPRVGRNAKEAYVTCLLLGQEYPFSFEMDDFGANSTDELHASFRENLRDGKEIEFTLKGGKKVGFPNHIIHFVQKAHAEAIRERMRGLT